jgi:hypothetical protein
VPINTSDVCSGAWFESLQVDGTASGTFSPGTAVFNTTTLTNGTHTILISSNSQNPGSVVLGTVSETLNVQNPAHYHMLGPGLTLPSESSCASAVDAFPLAEAAPWNENDGTGFNSNQPPSGGVPSYFYQNAPCCTELPNADFAAVDGAYGGTTDDIFRVYACKWGIDEDYVRALAWVETGWHQDCAAAHGGTGCVEGGDFNNPGGCATGLPVTSITPNGQFCGMEGFGGVTAPNQYASWSVMQNKVYYEWMTWPMMANSTPFGVDYCLAEMRGCMNGDEYSYFSYQDSSSGIDYQNAVGAAKANPNGASRVSGWTNLQYLAYGCIDTHYSGSWFNGVSDSYLDQFLSALSTAPWPGGNQ